MLKNFLSKLHNFMITHYAYKKKTLCPLFFRWGSTASRLQSHFFKTVIFYHKVPRNSWYSFDQHQKDEKLSWPWRHPVVLNSCINLVITKYKLKSQYVKLTQLWPLTVNCVIVNSQSYLAGLSGNCQKSIFSANM